MRPISYKLDLRPLDRVVRDVRAACQRAGTIEPMDRLFSLWGVRYLAFAKRRFSTFSRGGGDWPPLRRARRRVARPTWSGPRKHAILVDTGTLFGALDIGAPGNLYRRTSGGFEVGFGGPARHPKGRLTIARLAAIHNQGLPPVPRRQIIVLPDSQTAKGMKADAVAMAQKTMARYGKRSR